MDKKFSTILSTPGEWFGHKTHTDKKKFRSDNDQWLIQQDRNQHYSGEQMETVHTYEQIYVCCKRTFLELIVVAVTDKW